MIRIYTKNKERTIFEMEQMWRWLVSSFGIPEKQNKWTYGKDEDWVGSTFCDGPFDVEWIEFSNEADATLFTLRWQ